MPATLGIVALYLQLLVIANSYLRSHLNAAAWRSVDGFSLVAYAVGLAHTLMAGHDRGAVWAPLLFWVTNSVVLILIVFACGCLPILTLALDP